MTPSLEKPAMSTSTQLVGLVVWLAISFAAAAVGGIASANAGEFYQELVRPPWAPPAWLFGPVWTVLYLMIGVAAWLVWRECGWKLASGALRLFLVQLAANALWTWIFFAWREGGFALAEILVLWLLIAGTIAAFWRIVPLAGLLLLPYLGWVTYATALTYALWTRNPDILG